MSAASAGAAPSAPRVLVVDDDRSMRMIAGEALGAAGFAVQAAADATAALELIDAFGPDLILLDVDLPDIDGIALCSRLRDDPKTREIPVCMMTGMDDLASIQRAYEAGATDFVIKPPTWVILVQRLRYIHRASLAARQLAAANRDLTHAGVVFDHIPEAVVVTDRDAVIISVNPAFTAINGYTAEEAIGRKTSLLKSGRQDEAFYRDLWDTIASGRVWEGRIVNRKKDGSLYSEDMTISPVRDGSGRIVNYVAVMRDVTERLRAAEEKARLEDQLRQAQKVEAIGRLAGGVAHDFNNLTAIVLGYGEMLLGRLASGDPMRKWAEQILEAGRRSAALTRQLLAFSRKQALQPEVLEINELLLNLQKMLDRVIGEDVRMEFRLSPGAGRIAADPGQIEQVVTNLVVNSRDAMPQGGWLVVETADAQLDESYTKDHEGVDPGRYVMLAVSDSGCGMDRQTMSMIFEPFFTTKVKGKGTGLGLATAHGIVRQSGGHIFVYSEPGQGTTFKIYLPRVDVELTAKPAGAAGEAARGLGERVLVVEDEAPLRELCATVLTNLGYRASGAENGSEALLMVEKSGLKPDLVLADVIMPGMSGSELAARLRERQPDLKVLFMSGYPDEAIARHGVLEPGTPFIQKPFSERALAAKVRELLGG